MDGFAQTTLPNGLRVVTQPMRGAQTVAVAVSVDVGSRYEGADENGISHMLEHMAFKGTERRNAKQIAEEMDAIGASFNAFTSSESTVYYARLLPEDLPLAVDLLADILQHSTFDAEEMERERGVILQEIAAHTDTPDDLAFDFFHEVAYPNQPLGRSILGTPELVSGFAAENLSDYMRKHYHADNMVLSVAGNVEHERVVKLAQDAFGELEKGDEDKPLPIHYGGGEKREARQFEQMHVTLGFPGVSYHDPDYYAAQVMVTALGGGMSSRLFQEVREKRGLAYSVHGFMSAYSDGGIFGVYAASSEARGAELMPVLCDSIAELAEKGISEEELSRAKRQHMTGLKMQSEHVSSVSEWLGRHTICYGEFRDLESMLSRYERVQAADVQRALTRMLQSGPPSLAVVGPHAGLTEYERIVAHFASYHSDAA